MTQHGTSLRARRRVWLRWVTLFAASVLVLCQGPVTWGQDTSGAADATARVVHVFDFDERGAGNLEEVPMFWSPLHTAGFPRYATGTFDYEVGASAPPSLYLHGNGRNVAYQYTGPQTRVRTNSGYRVEFALKPRGLLNARACVSAQFLDQRGEPLLDTLVRSDYLGGDATSDWIRPVLTLTAAPPEARTIGLTVWVMQESYWRQGVSPRRHIPRVDVNAGVWVDDIVIQTLPRVELATTAPGNVIAAHASDYIRVVLADTEASGLRGLLSIYAAEGRLVQSMPLAASYDEFVEPVLVTVSHLLPGYYHVVLQVFAGNKEVVSRRLTFAKLADFGHETHIHASPFGIVLQPDWRQVAETGLALLRHQLAQSVKIPIWSGLQEVGQTPAEKRRADHIYTDLITEGFVVTGVLSEHPEENAADYLSFRQPLVELLADRQTVWEEHLSTAVAPYANTVRWWQIGDDNGRQYTDAHRLTVAATQLRDVFKRFISSPLLAIPEQSPVAPGDEKFPVDQVCLNLWQGMPAAAVGALIQERKEQGYGRATVYVEALPADRYARLPRLADWAQRLITARFEGANTVFTSQTWHNRQTLDGTVIEPDEGFLVLRTIAALVNEAVPGRRFSLPPDVTCLSFDHGDTTILAMWDPQAPPEGRDHVIQLGQADRVVDMWGRSTSLSRDRSGRHVVRLSPMPVLVPRVEKWLIDFRTSMSIDPRHIESGSELSGHHLTLTHSGATAVSGEILLAPPDGWKVSPKHLDFSLMPQRVERLPVQLNYPHTEAAGEKTLTARIRLIDVPYYLEIPLPLELALTDIEVSGMAVATGNSLILRHTVTNHTSEVLHFRSAAQVPGRQRQYRPISNLSPGESQTVEYRFSQVQRLVGARVRLSLREMNDGPRTHALELTVQ